jgi:hypothetical protein
VLALSVMPVVRADATIQALWVFSDELTDPADRSALVERSASGGVTDLYISVYRSSANAAGRRLYDEQAIADLIARAHARGLKVWAAYGAPDWPALGCGPTAFPLRRLSEIVAYNRANPAAPFDGVTLDVEPPDPQSEADFQKLVALYRCSQALLKPHGVALAAAIRFYWDKPIGMPGSGIDLRPKDLLLYYGAPSRINGAGTGARAAAELAKYDYVVLGDGFEKPFHPDHADTSAVLRDPSLDATLVFGYIDAGVTTQNLAMAELKLRVDEWKAAGAEGVFFENFGYATATTRARQNEVVDHAHGRGMRVLVSAPNPDDAFGQSVSAMNPFPARATRLSAADFYLYQNHQIRGGVVDSPYAWRTKADILAAYQSALRFSIFSTTSNDPNDLFDQAKFFYSWHSALMYGHEATGWGEHGYAVQDAVAPFRARPAIDPGSDFLSPVAAAGSSLVRRTTQGQIVVDPARSVSGFALLSTGRPAYQHIIDLDLDAIVVMGYRDFAGRGCLADDGIICLTEDEIAYADRRPQPPRILIGLETANCTPGCGPSKVTFFEEGRSRLATESLMVSDHFRGSRSFAGFALQGYGDAFWSGAPGWPK